MPKYVLFVFALTALFLITGCGPARPEEADHVIMSMNKRINTMDPALAADTTSQSIIGAFYDTLLQYRYKQGEYVLIPGMLTKLPDLSEDQKTYTCELREDLCFPDGAPFRGKPERARRITAKDVVFSLLRLADTRLQSPGYWVIRDRICGLKEFRAATGKAPAGDLSPYDLPCAGFTILDDLHFQIHLEQPNPRFYYFLALPYCAVVSREAVAYYGDKFAQNPLGSGPFVLEKWEPDYVLEMVRNPDYRPETFAEETDPRLAGKRLPYADRITCFQVKQPISSWLMFLQGELDYYALDADHFESVVDPEKGLASALRERGIRLVQAPQLETNYIGFNFADPLLASNRDLRIAISLAFDRNMRVAHSAGRFIPAYGPVPPGTAGELKAAESPFARKNVEEAKRYMIKAGFPGGIDPRTGRALEIAFDQTGSDTFYRQTAELMAEDMRRIGIKIVPGFHTRPRFLQKLQQGGMQLFRFSWTGDYPDAENFLQLFYGPFAGSCNRVSYRDPAFDAMFREILSMPPSAERDKKYHDMSLYLARQCPWIFETHTTAFILTHDWLKNYVPHDFAFSRWKYLSSDSRKRKDQRKQFQPVSMNSLR